MRVLHVYSGNLFGGVERFLVTLAQEKEVCPEMQSSFALCFEGRLQSELEGAGAKVYRLGAVRISWPWTVWRARKRLGEILKEEHFDIIICHSVWPQALFGPVVRSNGLPLVFWCHDAPAGNHWLEKWARRVRPDFVIANSRYTERVLPKLYPGVTSQTVYCPVSPIVLDPRQAVRETVRTELKTSRNGVAILQSSRLEPWKGHFVLLQALAHLKDLPDWVCWIAGGPQRPHEATYLKSLTARAKELGIGERVQFLGERRDIPRLLIAADIYCQPNTAPEPFGIALVEALSAGLPVVTTALGGAKEVVDESCGCLFPANDVNAVAGGLKELILNPEKRGDLGREGIRKAYGLSAPEKQLPRLCDLLARLTHDS
jgi:glycosyltransferase involved in cell wall biosynthesis